MPCDVVGSVLVDWVVESVEEWILCGKGAWRRMLSVWWALRVDGYVVTDYGEVLLSL